MVTRRRGCLQVHLRCDRSAAVGRTSSGRFEFGRGRRRLVPWRVTGRVSHRRGTVSHMSQAATLEGILHFKDDRADGVLRDPAHPLRQVQGGIFVSRQLIRELQLRPGLMVKGQPKGRHLTRLQSVEGFSPQEYAERTHIYEGTALDPHPMLRLEHDPNEITTRMIDILTPIGFGQRGLIVAPPRTGKTILLQNIAKGIHANYPDAELNLLLIDERPEEVTDMRRNIPGTVYASSNDNTVEKHLDLA